MRARAKASIDELRESYANTYDLDVLSEADRAAFEGIFDGYAARAAQATTKAEADRLPGLLQSREASRIVALFTPPEKPPVTVDDPPVGPDPAQPPVNPAPPQPRNVSARSLVPRHWKKPVLATHEDAAAYADEIRRRIEEAIDNGYTVTIY